MTESGMGEAAVMNLAMHPQKSVLACGAENRCRIIEFTKDKLISLSEFQTDFFDDKETSDQKAVIFLPNGEVLATAGVDGVVRLWDWESKKAQAELRPSSAKEIASMDISPDGLLLAVVTGQAGDVCRIWQLGSDKKFRETHCLSPPGDKSLCFRDCKFSPDGKYLFTIQTKSRSNSFVSKWAVNGWKEKSTTISHTRAAGACVALNVSQDGKYIATGSGEGEIALFRTHDMRWIKKKLVHGFFVSKVAFSPDRLHSSQLSRVFDFG